MTVLFNKIIGGYIMLTKQKKDEIRKILDDNFDHHSVRKGVYTVKESYFYRHGKSPETLYKKIQKVIPEVKLVELDDKFNAWPKDSYFIVNFTVE